MQRSLCANPSVGHFCMFYRSASVSTLPLDRSGSSMVPSYDSSVSPPTSRAMSVSKTGTKLDHSEEERKILLVLISYVLLFY